MDLSAEARLLVVDSTGFLVSGTWTPDGRWLVYQRNGDIGYKADNSDSTAHVFLDTPFNDWNPAVHPDGRWIAFVSVESGVSEVWVAPFPGPGGREQVSSGGGTMPVWARDGRELFYRDGEGYLTVAKIRTEPVFAVESRERLFKWTPYFLPSGLHPQFDVQPDDQRFLAIAGSRAEDEEGRLVVVEHLSTLLRERAPE